MAACIAKVLIFHYLKKNMVLVFTAIGQLHWIKVKALLFGIPMVRNIWILALDLVWLELGMQITLSQML